MAQRTIREGHLGLSPAVRPASPYTAIANATHSRLVNHPEVRSKHPATGSAARNATAKPRRRPARQRAAG
jgi:hypothetical protein